MERIREVICADGRRLACDFVVLGIGVAPATDFLAGSGIDVADGVRVDERLQTNVPDVFAAGDVAAFVDPVFGGRRRVEHWDNAVKQGRLAARNMLGQGLPYDEVSSFFCDALGANFQFFGMCEGSGERLRLGAPETGSWAVLYLDRQVPRALFTMGRPATETQAIRSLVRYRTHVGRFRAKLARPGFSMAEIPNQTVLVLQGGGAMGAFESGVVRALERHRLHPDVVAGVSIGAFNGAIIASHPRHAADALEAFWHDLAVATPAALDEQSRQLLSAAAVATGGVPGFFLPRWLLPPFGALAASPVRLLVSAVDVESAELRIFDSRVEGLRVDHLVASGSLPPALPWTTIDGRRYWDGGIVSNSPLDQVAERCGTAGKRIFVVDLFPSARPLPADMMEVVLRRDEIAYAEKVRRTCGEQTTLSDFRKLVEDILGEVDGETARRIRQRPRFSELMGSALSHGITRIVRPVERGERASRDFDFSAASLRANALAGYRTAMEVLRSEAASR